MSRRGPAKKEGPEGGEDSNDYRKRRDRNNLAVKKYRMKLKQKTQETVNWATELRNENSVLKNKLKTLTNELNFLKELFLAYISSNVGPKLQEINFKKLLEGEPMEGTSNALDESYQSFAHIKKEPVN